MKLSSAFWFMKLSFLVHETKWWFIVHEIESQFLVLKISLTRDLSLSVQVFLMFHELILVVSFGNFKVMVMPWTSLTQLRHVARTWLLTLILSISGSYQANGITATKSLWLWWYLELSSKWDNIYQELVTSQEQSWDCKKDITLLQSVSDDSFITLKLWYTAPQVCSWQVILSTWIIQR